MPWLNSVVAVQFTFAVLPWVRVWPCALYMYVASAGLLSGYIMMVFQFPSIVMLYFLLVKKIELGELFEI